MTVFDAERVRGDCSPVFEPSRRALIAGTAAASIATFMPSRSLFAQPLPGIYRFKVGAADITVLSDGAMELPVNVMLPRRAQSAIDSLFTQAGQTFSNLTAQINVAIIKLGTEVILIDTGGGPDFMPTLGKLSDRMEAAGIKPDTITRVIFTHAHPDHLWGVIDPLGGGTLFEKAEHVMSSVEFEFWIKADVDTRVPVAFRGMAVGTHRRLKAIADRIKTIAPRTEIAPGVHVVDTSGHTPGHLSVMVRSETEQLLIGGVESPAEGMKVKVQ